MQRFQESNKNSDQNGQVLTGGQMPSNGVPEQKPAVPDVQIVEKQPATQVTVAAISTAPAGPAPTVVNLEAINRAAAQQATPVQQPMLQQQAPQPQFQQQQQPQQFQQQQFGFYQQPFQDVATLYNPHP